MTSVFIDGSAGTTGLRIAERLDSRSDIQLIRLSEEKRKDPAARREALNAADIAFLCLPDDAAREAVAMISSDRTVVIDTSTAHRTADGWVYGFPEIGGRREKIRTARRIANPGCHASGFIALVAPLTEYGLLDPAAALSCCSLTGYSGGGKKMIAAYESADRDPLLDAPRMYGLTQQHKHLPEMQAVCGLAAAPVFCPVVAPYYAGMQVTVPLFSSQVKQVVNRNAEGFRQRRKQRNIRHRNSVLPFGYRLGADTELFCQLFLGLPRPQTELFDFCPEFHSFPPESFG